MEGAASGRRLVEASGKALFAVLFLGAVVSLPAVHVCWVCFSVCRLYFNKKFVFSHDIAVCGRETRDTIQKPTK